MPSPVVPKSSFQCLPPLVERCDFIPAPPGMAGPIPVNCTCVAPPVGTPPALCTVSLVYPSSRPGEVYLAARDAGCDGAGIEIALAVLLAKLMTSAPLP